MKRRISETYHFERNDARDGYIHGQLKDAIGILGGPEEIAGGDQRVFDQRMFSAVNALLEGFTMEQFMIGALAIGAAFERRLARHEQGDTEFARAVLAQTSQARRRYMDTLKEMLDALSEAVDQKRDGFEKFRDQKA